MLMVEEALRQVGFEVTPRGSILRGTMPVQPVYNFVDAWGISSCGQFLRCYEPGTGNVVQTISINKLSYKALLQHYASEGFNYVDQFSPAGFRQGGAYLEDRIAAADKPENADILKPDEARFTLVDATAYETDAPDGDNWILQGGNA